MYQTWQNGKNPNFGLNFDTLGAILGPQKMFLSCFFLLVVRHGSNLSSYAI